MAPFLEINMYPFHTVFSMPQFMNPAFYVSPFSAGAEELSKECSVYIVFFQCM